MFMDEYGQLYRINIAANEPGLKGLVGATSRATTGISLATSLFLASESVYAVIWSSFCRGLSEYIQFLTGIKFD